MQGALLRLEGALFDNDGSLIWLEALSGQTALMYKKGADAPRDISGGMKIRAVLFCHMFRSAQPPRWPS